jgi:TonB family protein
MRNILLLLVLLAWTAGLHAQQEIAPSVEDGPMAVPTGPAAVPQPDEDGVYRLGPGITAPTIVTSEPADYPQGAQESDVPHIGIYAVVVGADGTLKSVKCIFANESVYDAGAISAIQNSRFTPGMLGDKPVPVLVDVRVPFFHLKPAMPMIQQRYALRAEGRQQASERIPGSGLASRRGRMANGVTQPKVLHSQAAEFSEEARRERIEGNVVVSLTVSEEGLPTNLRVVRSMGYGLDEKALWAVSQYRFEPATKDGKPVAVPIAVEVSFRFAR